MEHWMHPLPLAVFEKKTFEIDGNKRRESQIIILKITSEDISREMYEMGFDSFFAVSSLVSNVTVKIQDLHFACQPVHL